MSRQKLTSLVLATLMVMSVFAGTVAFAGTAAAGNTASDHDYDSELQDGDIYWAGQDVLVTASANETIAIYEGDGTFVAERQAGSGGHYVLDTSDYDGDYYVEFEDSSTTNFSVYQQSLNSTVTEETVTNGETDSTTELSFESNRGSFNLTVSEEDLSGADLADLYADYPGTLTVDSENDTVTLVDYDQGTEFPLNFKDVDAGNYTFQFDTPDSTAETTQNIEVVKEKQSDASLDQTIYTQERGDIVELTVNLENTEEANVTIGDEDVAYVTNFTVRDGDGDGKVHLRFNTYTAGHDGFVPVILDQDESSGDELVIEDEDNIEPHRLESAVYDISVSTDGRETDVGSIDLNERSTDSIETHVAPESANINELEDIDGNVVSSDAVSEGDYLVFEVSASGLSGWFPDYVRTSGDLAQDANSVSNTGTYVTIEEAQADMNAEPDTIPVEKGAFYPDAQNDTFYLVFNANDFDQEVVDDGEYTASVVMNESSPYVDDEDATEKVNTSFEVVEEEVTFDGHDETSEDPYELESNENGTVTVTGESTVAPGTELDIRVRAEGESPLLKSDRATVAEDGTFEAEFDFSDVAEGTNVTLEARDYTDEIDSVFTGYTPPEPASLSTEDVTAQQGESVTELTVSDVYLPSDGFIVIIDEETNVVGTSELISGDQGSVTVSLDREVSEDATLTAIAYQDNGDEVFTGSDDQPFTNNGSMVQQSASVTFEATTHTVNVNVANESGDAVDADVTLNGQTKTAADGQAAFEGLEDGEYTVEVSADGYQAANETVTVEGGDASVDVTLTAEQTDTPTETTESNESTASDNGTESGTETTQEETPGFGVVVALVALLGAALVAHRRD